jgi:hypothetical protein
LNSNFVENLGLRELTRDLGLIALLWQQFWDGKFSHKDVHRDRKKSWKSFFYAGRKFDPKLSHPKFILDQRESEKGEKGGDSNKVN